MEINKGFNMFCETAPSAVLLGTWRRGCQVQAFFHMLFGDDAVELLADQRQLQEATRAGFFLGLQPGARSAAVEQCIGFPQFQTLNLQATLTCEALVNLMSYMI